MSYPNSETDLTSEAMPDPEALTHRIEFTSKRIQYSDATKPCATCRRSHKNALAHAEPGVVVPPEPVCTYDEATTTHASTHDGPKSRYERLENRINELESLLRQQDDGTGQSPPQQHTPASVGSSIAHSPQNPLPTASNSPTSTENTFVNVPPLQYSAMPSTTMSDPVLMGAASAFPPPYPNLPPAADPLPTVISHPPHQVPTPPQEDMGFLFELLWPSWPARLPPPDLLHHLVDVFFNVHPHANRILHRSTFQAALSLSPTSPDFPRLCVLHAICAAASFYTTLVRQPPLPDWQKQPYKLIFRRLNDEPSFGELHARYAHEAQGEAVQAGHIFETVQSDVILSWFYFTHGKWVEVWVASGDAIRNTIPLGLHLTDPTTSFVRGGKRITLLPPAKDSVEDETRRSTFWLAYAVERFQAVGNGWATSVDDKSISQTFPALLDNFQRGIGVPLKGRQRMNSKDILTYHPVDQTDSFTLYVKSSILLSRVKNFNSSFPLNQEALDSLAAPDQHPQHVDPRSTAEFQKIEAQIWAFRLNVPNHLRNPIVNNTVDGHLLAAYFTQYTSIILLHNPHTDHRDITCVSTQKILTAVRGTLEYVYALCNTSFDLTLLDPSISTSFLMAATEIIRIARARKEAGLMEEALSMRNDFDVIKYAMSRMAERLPIAARHVAMIDRSLEEFEAPVGAVMGAIEDFENACRTDVQGAAADTFVPFHTYAILQDATTPN
ncbi:hypothetical protein SISNIDRAFT_548277 [Sistotremastrum niveocremeum HHB9708]|uniref:Xylanolytic transcriptional activator regulatory domain-containing protein n=1 Tax=Sistotremastrum niveocremeum HHB9708 TaxID=1314777 RepID=A0A164XQ11_9AGAM|nr:hypothetical protein SISNIDRAFT_548277 [Sistotremastrum niveocremeum HHB9708]